MTSPLAKAAAMMVAGIGLYWILGEFSGAWLWLAATLAVMFFIGGTCLLLGAVLPRTRLWRSVAINALIATATTGLIFTSLELLLPLFELANQPEATEARHADRAHSAGVPEPSAAWVEPDIDPEALKLVAARGNPLTMPPEWEKRHVDIPGAKKAYYWHGALHVRDANRFRRTTPFPAKPPDTFRIMVVGDSLTYGSGIDAYWTYPAVLERRLRKAFNVEVLNLGIGGHQSKDILGVVETWLPVLKPDLVIYGVCLNDFLPSDTNQDVFDSAYALPLPRKISALFTEKTRLGAFLGDRYDALLRKWDLRQDFFDGILTNIENYQKRFTYDVTAMNTAARAHGLPPMIGMVLHQQPRYNDRDYQLARTAEESMLRAGFSVVPIEDYYRRYDNRNLAVSQWEGHPNEEANQIFAAMLENPLQNRPELEPYRMATPKNGATPGKASTNTGK